MLPQKYRLILDSDFYKIKKFGKRISCSLFTISYIEDKSLINPTLSVVVSKLISKKASQRNKLKRITRGLIIRNIAKIPNNIRCIIYPKFVLISAKSKDAEQVFLKLLSDFK